MMISRNAATRHLAAMLVVLGASFGWNAIVFGQPAPGDDAEGVEVLTRGPVHEAFAETVTFDPQPGIVVPIAPPDAIEEMPPDQRPEGENVAWIPGYWAWDDDREDFLWVSGIWRSLPPGRQWVPGYWGESGRQFQWTSGYWADAELAEVRYLPEPPATAEVGPNIAAPSANHLWAPGSWVWNTNRYAWRPGYWMAAQQNWVWVPAHYLWSPRGYVFVDGYYDYSVANRGILFAPVYFNSRVFARQGFSYRPAIVINPAVFVSQLFLRPNYGHYYFGDYYATSYSRAGYYPWFSYSSGGHGYDPIYAQARWQNRQNTAWARTVETDYQHRVEHQSARPPRTFAAQQALVASRDNSVESVLVAAAPLALLAKSKDSPMRFQSVNKVEQQALAKHGREIRQFRAERQRQEVQGDARTADGPAQGSPPATMKLPKSPIVAKSFDQLDKEHAPPKADETPVPDLNVEPKPRKPGLQPRPPRGEGKLPRTDPRDEPNPSPGVEPKPVPRVGPKPAPRGEPKPAPGVGPKPAPRGEPKPAPGVGPKPAPRGEPKPAPRVEPKPAPRGEPKPAPKVEPKPAPKGEPKPAPKVEPKVTPKPAPKVEPKPNPKPAPRPKPPKGEPKDKSPKAEPKGNLVQMARTTRRRKCS